MAVDESACFELDCCPPGNSIPPIITTEPLLIEADVSNNILLTESDLPLFS